MRTLFLYGIAATVLLVGCSQPRMAQYTRPAPKPILVDEYSVLDDRSNAPPLSDEKLHKQMELARAHYLKALKLAESGNQKDAAKHFEASVTLLNDLVTHPDIDALPEYTRLSQSVVRDYEGKITSIESLDSNSSFFVLRDKMFQEIELLPVSWHRPVEISAETGPEKVDTLQIALSENEAVEQTIAFFTSEKGRKFFSKWLARSGRYFPLYERILAEEGAPDEIKYLSMIESGLNTRVTSSAQAVGLWQFISGTGREYGMKIDWYRDERRDPEKATRAAARYLLDLYEDMGDWHLALASYNCGPGRMRRALRKSDSIDYWIARNYLPRETRQYVPLYIAAAKIARDPEAYGFTDIVPEQPDVYEVVPVTGAYDFKTLANAVNLTEGELRELNPELLRDQIPPGETDYQLRVPVGFSRPLALALDTIPAPQAPSVSWLRHKVKRGETVSRIAARYGVSVSSVLEANGMNRRSTLLRGKVLRIPVKSSSGSDDSNDAIAEESKTEKNTNSTPAAKSDRAESSQAVAAAPGRSADKPAQQAPAKTAQKKTTPAQKESTTELLAEAPTAERKSNQPALPEAQAETPVAGSSAAPATRQVAARAAETTPAKKRTVVIHKVKRGETLSGIADRYNVSASDVRKWNPKGVNRRNQVLRGASLRIYQNGASQPASPRIAASTSGKSKSKTATRKKSQPKRYKVRRGDTLTSIANRFGMSVNDLRNSNPRLNPNRLRAGQVIQLR